VGTATDGGVSSEIDRFVMQYCSMLREATSLAFFKRRWHVAASEPTTCVNLRTDEDDRKEQNNPARRAPSACQRRLKTGHEKRAFRRGRQVEFRNVVHACNRAERLERTPANAAKALEKPSSDRMALNPPGAHPLTERL
jgi:hypothetical protein